MSCSTVTTHLVVRVDALGVQQHLQGMHPGFWQIWEAKKGSHALTHLASAQLKKNVRNTPT